MIEFMQRNRGRSMSTPGPLYGTKFNTQRYKSEICQRYMESGQCKYGEKCQFAHGEHELRVINKHPKFKTVPCKTFHQSGTVSHRGFFIRNSATLSKVADILEIVHRPFSIEYRQL